MAPIFPTQSVVYLLHFSHPYKQARHYLGWTGRKPMTRIREHQRGKGTPLTRAAAQDGIVFDVARLWWGGTKTDEKRIRNMKCSPKLCPICNPKAHQRGERKRFVRADIPF